MGEVVSASVAGVEGGAGEVVRVEAARGRLAAGEGDVAALIAVGGQAERGEDLVAAGGAGREAVGEGRVTVSNIWVG
jgi:hypothetical protein